MIGLNRITKKQTLQSIYSINNKTNCILKKLSAVSRVIIIDIDIYRANAQN